MSAANCVAAMLVPACHPFSVFPARKYSSSDSEALWRARSPDVMAYAMKARTMSRSSMAGKVGMGVRWREPGGRPVI